MNKPTQNYFVFETAAGFCGIAWSNAGITRFMLPSSTAQATEHNLQRRVANAQPGTPPAPVMDAIEAAKRYFAGEQIDFSELQLDLSGQDTFFKQIYEAARSVGQAMAKNPVPLIIPCHRVLAAGGKLGGFSAPGGSATKQRMLEMEGSLAPPPPTQQTLGL
jgi:methylated-DNA-[protein]-cysteine S-methyltransferase